MPASLSSPLGLPGASCCLPGQGCAGAGAPGPLAALPLLATRSRDRSGDPLAQTDSEERQPCALPHRGSWRAAVRGHGGGDGEDEAHETLNPGKVQGLCRSPAPPREGEERYEEGQGTPLLRQRHLTGEEREGWPGAAVGLSSPSPILQRSPAGAWRRRSGKKRLELGRLSWLSRSLASSSPISTGQRVPRAPPFLQPSSPSPAGRAARSRPALAQTWVETGESALESETEHREGTDV